MSNNIVKGSANIPLIGCGILKSEVKYLAKKNNWPIDYFFLDSSLHVDFEELAAGLSGMLNKHSQQECIVLYGVCHPLMDQLLKGKKATRTCGQNCIDMLLGNRVFTEKLSEGAFFLMEDWANNWERITRKTFGDSMNIIRDVFKGDREYLLCINTPCSNDYQKKAEEISAMLDMRLEWMDVNLDHLESVLMQTLAQVLGENKVTTND